MFLCLFWVTLHVQAVLFGSVYTSKGFVNQSKLQNINLNNLEACCRNILVARFPSKVVLIKDHRTANAP